jgi:hypothetical protein
MTTLRKLPTTAPNKAARIRRGTSLIMAVYCFSVAKNKMMLSRDPGKRG